MTLHLFDLKAYLHAGSIGNKTIVNGFTQGGYRFTPKILPVSAINFVLNTIYEFSSDDNVLIYADERIPRIKKELMESLNLEYKAGRKKPSKEYTIQLHMIREILDMLGVTRILMEDYEADDVISSIIYKYSDLFIDIIIHSNDADLYHLVSDKVSIMPVNNKGKYITTDNYEDTVDSRFYVKYNRVIFTHLYKNKPSNSNTLPRLSEETMKTINKLIPPILDKYLGDTRKLDSIMKNILKDDDYKIFKLVIPMYVDIDLDNGFTTDYDKSLYVQFCSKFTVKYFKDKQVDVLSNEVIELIDKYTDKYMEAISCQS